MQFTAHQKGLHGAVYASQEGGIKVLVDLLRTQQGTQLARKAAATLAVACHKSPRNQESMQLAGGMDVLVTVPYNLPF